MGLDHQSALGWNPQSLCAAEPHGRSFGLLVGQVEMADGQDAGPLLLCREVSGEEIPAYGNVIIEEDGNLSVRDLGSGVPRRRPLHAFAADDRAARTMPDANHPHRRTGNVVDNHDLESAGQALPSQPSRCGLESRRAIMAGHHDADCRGYQRLARYFSHLQEPPCSTTRPISACAVVLLPVTVSAASSVA